MLQKCFHETIKFFLVFIVKEEKEKPILCEMHIFWSEKRHLCLQYQAKIAALLVVRILLYSIENRPFLCFIICIKMKNSPPIPTHSPHVYEFKAALEVNCCLKLTYVHTWFPDVSFLTSNKLKMYVLNVIFVLGTIERKPILASKYWSQRKKHSFDWKIPHTKRTKVFLFSTFEAIVASSLLSTCQKRLPVSWKMHYCTTVQAHALNCTLPWVLTKSEIDPCKSVTRS